MQQLSAASRYVINDEVEPKRVVPQSFSLRIASGQLLQITLPHESVTVIHLRGH